MSLSVGAVLYAGFIPGILIMLSQMIYVKVNSKRLKLPKHEKVYSKAEKRNLIRNGIVALIMPLIILCDHYRRHRHADRGPRDLRCCTR